ncbi:hypothetical protein GCM10027159_02490 [Lysobacter terrae]
MEAWSAASMPPTVTQTALAPPALPHIFGRWQKAKDKADAKRLLLEAALFTLAISAARRDGGGGERTMDGPRPD